MYQFIPYSTGMENWRCTTFNYLSYHLLKSEWNSGKNENSYLYKFDDILFITSVAKMLLWWDVFLGVISWENYGIFVWILEAGIKYLDYNFLLIISRRVLSSLCWIKPINQSNRLSIVHRLWWFCNHLQ